MGCRPLGLVLRQEWKRTAEGVVERGKGTRDVAPLCGSLREPARPSDGSIDRADFGATLRAVSSISAGREEEDDDDAGAAATGADSAAMAANDAAAAVASARTGESAHALE